MVIVKEVRGKKIKDSRGADTIEVTVCVDGGCFSASAPNGKSRGKFEVKIWKRNIDGDIRKLEKLKNYFSNEKIEKFDDLRRLEDICDGHVGGNTVLALEYATLRALASEKKCEVWELINSKANEIPRFLGNCVGGGSHTSGKHKKPDFQEFLISANLGSARLNYEKHLEVQLEVANILKKEDSEFRGRFNDEHALVTSFNDREVLSLLLRMKIDLGVDVAAASFYKRKKYNYMNPVLKRTGEEQLHYMANLMKNFNLLYTEDMFDEQDFESFAKLLKMAKKGQLVVGDDLTVTNPKRLNEAIKEKSINALIVKPNQIGSLIQMKEVVKIAKDNKLKMIFSHRSGETTEDILSDLAFGFGADFLKCGVGGKERVPKIKRLIAIENSLK